MRCEPENRVYRVSYPARGSLLARVAGVILIAGGVLIGNPVPEEYAMDFDEMSAVIDRVLAKAEAAGVKGKDITPFMLAHIVEETGGESLKTNMQLAYNNAKAAAQIAVALSKLG